MQTIRSFIAIPLAADVRRSAVRLMGRLRQVDDGIRWVPTDNLHLTLKFLGEVGNTDIPRVCDTLHGIARELEPFELLFTGTDGFPDIDRPRVLVSKIDDTSGSLIRLVSRLESDLAELGFKPEPRDYRPHLTLGRTGKRSRYAGAEVVQRLQAQRDKPLGRMVADTIQVFASFMDKGGPTYQVMDTIEL